MKNWKNGSDGEEQLRGWCTGIRLSQRPLVLGIAGSLSSDHFVTKKSAATNLLRKLTGLRKCGNVPRKSTNSNLVHFQANLQSQWFFRS